MALPGQETYNAAFGGGAWQAPVQGGMNFMRAMQEAQALKAQQERQQMMDQLAMDRESKLDSRYDAKMASDEARFNQEMALKRQAMQNRPPAPVELTPGQKAADQAYGREYQNWVGGKRSGLEQGLGALAAAKKRIYGEGTEPRKDLSGTYRAALPDFVRPFMAPEQEAVKQDVRSAVVQTLRATLGAQFTEKEGERIFAMAWDDKLPIRENIAKLDRVMQQYKTQYEEENAKARYFEDKGTLAGYKFGGNQEPPAMDAKMQRLQELRAKRGM